MISKDNKYGLLTVLIAFLMLFYFYGTVLLNLNDYVFAGGGDGIKNYYTYLYHATYDNSFFEFTGMNYPFNENIIFTDAHPLLSFVIGKFGLAEYGIGILNFLMLASYPICAFFVFKIFRFYKLPILWSVLYAVAITFMSPQIFRLTGHLSLSYVFAIPVMWYLLLKMANGKRFLWLFVSVLYLLIFFFTHPYLGLILSVFALFYWAVFFFTGCKSLGHIKKTITNAFIQVGLPIIIFQVIIILVDSHSGRLNNPAGFFDLHSTVNSFLVAHHGPIIAIKPFFGWESNNWESWAYIGLTTMLFFIVSTAVIFIKRKEINFKSHLKSSWFIFGLASICALLFAMCIPFRWSWFKWIANSLGPLKQFRVLGRFGWIFFYVFTIINVLIVYKMFKKINKTLFFNVLMVIGLVLFYFEFSAAHKVVNEQISAHKNPFKIENTTKEFQELISSTKANDFDAVIFLPFTHMSSESVFVLGSEKGNYDALMYSFHSHMPLLNTISSRTSLNEAINMVNLFSPDFIEKNIVKIIGSDKKIGLITNKDDLDSSEQRMVNNSKQIFTNNEFNVYDFSFKQWNNNETFQEVISKSNDAKIEHNNSWYSDTITWFYYDGFENSPDKNAMAGEGAFAQKKIGWNKLIELNSLILEDGDYILNFWYNIDVGRPDVLAVAEKVNDDTTEWVDQFMVRETNLVVNNWAYVELKFSYKSTDKINILLTSGPSDDWLVVDELLIRKQGSPDLFKTDYFNNKYIKRANTEYLIYNNYWIVKNSFIE